jgi:hypothetical protein
MGNDNCNKSQPDSKVKRGNLSVEGMFSYILLKIKNKKRLRDGRSYLSKCAKPWIIVQAGEAKLVKTDRPSVTVLSTLNPRVYSDDIRTC